MDCEVICGLECMQEEPDESIVLKSARKRTLQQDDILCTNDDDEKPKQSKRNYSTEQHLKTFKPSLMLRNVFLRFSCSPTITYKAKVICKEPWGNMVELLEDAVDDNNNTVKMHTRLWCKWDGTVNIYSVPILEVMYLC